MKGKRPLKTLTEEEIDNLVSAQAENDSEWTKPIRVRGTRSAKVPLTADLAARAAFFARLHREPSVNSWLSRIIQERLNLEEAAFAGVKRELTTRKVKKQQAA